MEDEETSLPIHKDIALLEATIARTKENYLKEKELTAKLQQRYLSLIDKDEREPKKLVIGRSPRILVFETCKQQSQNQKQFRDVRRRHKVKPELVAAVLMNSSGDLERDDEIADDETEELMFSEQNEAVVFRRHDSASLAPVHIERIRLQASKPLNWRRKPVAFET